jgi:hypothetical protein
MDTVSTKLMGGLGNYMFQIATAFALSLRDNKKFICETYDTQVPQKPVQHYNNNLLRKIEFTQEYIPHTPHGESSFAFSEIPNIQGNIRLYGYFQSEKYFQKYRSEILDLFDTDEETKDKINQKYSSVLAKNPTSLHVRRGDYVWLSDYHYNQGVDYYKSATDIIGQEKLYLIFSDDIQWCKENLDFIENKILITDNTDYEDLYLMSLCENNIIANSSFSWWAAWLNKNENKKVISPKNWFGKSNSHLDTKDLYCDKWYVI